MAEIDGGRVAAKQLKTAGIDTIFGGVAGPTIQIMAGAAEEGIRVIGCRHEENGAFMAMAWGFVKKKPGVLVTGSGPGTTNALTPLYAATESGLPLELRRHEGYDHGYYFISTFIEDHLRHHAALLGA